MPRPTPRAALVAVMVVLGAFGCLGWLDVIAAAPRTADSFLSPRPVRSVGGDADRLMLHGFAATGEFVVGFAPHVTQSSARAAAAAAGLEGLRWIPQIRALVVRPVSTGYGGETPREVEEELILLAHGSDVLYVEADAVAASQMAPDDPRYATNQWAPQRIGADEAWDTTTGSSSVIVAVIDSGLDMDHEDLDGKWIQGNDIYNGDSDPSDDYGHGTWVSGIIGAGLDNAVGVASVGGATRIMPVKVADSSGSSSYSRISQGVTWAVDNGADIINVSLGGTADLYNLRNAMQYAYDAGVLVVAAAGNGGTTSKFYPAAYTTTMGVAATTDTDARWPSSNYGDWLSIAAPGSSIETTNWTGNGAGAYVNAGGTSMAAPHVAGVAALVLAACPGLGLNHLWDRLESAALDLGAPGFDAYFGHGRVDAAVALAAVCDATATPDPPTATSVPTTVTATVAPTTPTATATPARRSKRRW